jgi:peptidoglycan/xylan/chitin deacetylase (PgdA/CDA1 family)
MTPCSARLAEDAVAIFLFHGVVPEHRHIVRNYTRKHLSLARFEEVLDELRARGTCVSMADLAASRPLPPRAFAITFDDGFENNVSVAAPALRRRGLPATFYLTTDFVDGNRASWIDRIEEAVERVPAVDLRLPFLPGHGPWIRPEEKRALLDEIRRSVKADRSIDPDTFADGLRRLLDAGPFRPDPTLDQKLNWDQARALADDELFTLGGHGRTHRILAYLEPEELEREVADSTAILRRELRRPLEHYSYPEGLAHCYDSRVIETLRRYGIRCCPTAEDGVNRPGDDPFRLKRILVT